jgi:hypothetical protein
MSFSCLRVTVSSQEVESSFQVIVVAVRGKKLQFPEVPVWNLNSEPGNFYGSDSISEKFCDATLKYTVVSLLDVIIRIKIIFTNECTFY